MNSFLSAMRAAAILLCAVFTNCAQNTAPGPTNKHDPGNAPGSVKPSASTNLDVKRQQDAIRASNAPVVVQPPTRRPPDRSFTNYWTGSEFAPASLMNACWTNYLAKTNGAQFELWGKYILPAGWPKEYAGMPVLQWADDCIVHGAIGLTALCQCHTGQGNRGQVPMIAITRRHLYSRGHGMGIEMPTNVPVLFNYAGVKLYFCSADNKVIEAVSTNKLVYYGGGYDFSIISLTADLPDSIAPVRCINPTVFGPSPCAFPVKWLANGPPEPRLSTRQTGRLDCGWNSGHNEAVVGGDSGSPGFLWLGNELFFSFAISGSGPVFPKVQEGVDTLTRLLGLPTSKYQIQYLDVSSYPTYP